MALIKTVRGFTPNIDESTWLAENATIVGEVKLGKNCTVWFGAIVRGDVNFIRAGDNVNIQDGAVIHCTYQKTGTTIGNNVSIGHNALVHGCTLKDNVLVGMGAIVMDNVIVHENSIIAAGAVVLENTEIPAGSIYAGVPAKKVKDIDKRTKEMIDRTARNYPMYAQWFRESE